MAENEDVSAITGNLQMPPTNPLSGFFRQPKIFIRLPSKGEFYPEGALDVSETGEYPVYAMTAKDELMFKTPDALLSGQSTVEVIKSCVPAILQPWKMPSIDVDAILIAIRIASYGENMEITGNCPHCDAENSYEIPLTPWLSQAQQYNYESSLMFDELTVNIRPYTYKEVNQTAMKTFEQQRLLAIVNDEDMSDSEKIEKFSEGFVKLTELTVDIIAGVIDNIVTPDGTVVSNKKFIKEFIDNAPSSIFAKLQKHVSDLKDKVTIDDFHGKCNECGGEFDMPITMDQSSFFVNE